MSIAALVIAFVGAVAGCSGLALSLRAGARERRRAREIEMVGRVAGRVEGRRGSGWMGT